MNKVSAGSSYFLKGFDMDIPDLTGLRVLRVQREPQLKLISVWIVGGWEVIVDEECLRSGLLDGEYEGSSCGRGRDGERWGQNGGQPRKMTVLGSENEVCIRIHHPTSTAGHSISVAREDVDLALTQLLQE